MQTVMGGGHLHFGDQKSQGFLREGWRDMRGETGRGEACAAEELPPPEECLMEAALPPHSNPGAQKQSPRKGQLPSLPS